MAVEILLASLRPLAAAVDQAVTIVDQHGIVLEWNAKAERIYGMTRAEIMGKDIEQFFSSTALIVRQVLRDQQPVESTYHRPRFGIHVLITASPIFVEGRLVGALAVERDVTRLVELSAELMAATSRVADLEKQLVPVPSRPDQVEDPFRAIVGEHPAIARVIELARRIAPTEVVTIIRGESGVGKELFAHAIHNASRRSHAPFVALNCGAIPSTLFESELFGYASGAFTGANPRGQSGKLKLAQGGTLFLDEVGDLPLESQVKLLRFLEDRQFYRVGGTVPIAVDVRILVATNRPLEEMVKQGTFRDDLYWRLNVISLDLPPLRDRPQDVASLIEMCVHEFSLIHRRKVVRLDPIVVQKLLEHPWPGNVRELRNTVERLVVLASTEVIGPDLLPVAIRSLLPPLQRPASPPPVEQPESLHSVRGKAERDQILAALQATGGKKTAAANRLGIARGTLYNKCRELGITL